MDNMTREARDLVVGALAHYHATQEEPRYEVLDRERHIG